MDANRGLSAEIVLPLTRYSNAAGELARKNTRYFSWRAVAPIPLSNMDNRGLMMAGLQAFYIFGGMIVAIVAAVFVIGAVLIER